MFGKKTKIWGIIFLLCSIIFENSCIIQIILVLFLSLKLSILVEFEIKLIKL